MCVFVCVCVFAHSCVSPFSPSSPSFSSLLMRVCSRCGWHTNHCIGVRACCCCFCSCVCWSLSLSFLHTSVNAPAQGKKKKSYLFSVAALASRPLSPSDLIYIYIYIPSLPCLSVFFFFCSDPLSKTFSLVNGETARVKPHLASPRTRTT